MSQTRIGVLSPVTGGFYFGEVLAGVVREVAAVGGRVTLVQTLDAGHTGDEFVPAPDLSVPVAWDHLDGVIAIAQASSPTYLRTLLGAGKPVVLVSNDLGLETATVMSDNHTGVRDAVRHLVGHGHTRIAFVGNLAQTDMRERYEAYCAEMSAQGLPVERDLYLPTADHVETGGQGAVEAVLAVEPPVTAVVTSTDRIALGLISALTERGLVVPTDLAVIGFDDVEAGWHSTPPLATVNQQITELGAQAARLLLAELGGAPPAHHRHTVTSSLIPRRSCGCGGGAPSGAPRGATEGEELAGAVLAHLGLDPGGPNHAIGLTDVDRDHLEDVITSTVAQLFPTAPSPETLELVTETAVPLLTRAVVGLILAGLPGQEALTHAVARVSVALSQLEAGTAAHRSERLTVSLVEQYDVGMGLLGRVGSDPSDLTWLDRVSVRAGCLGLWEGPPESGILRITAVYDPQGLVTEEVGARCTVQQFPPRPLVDLADPAADEVAFVLPLRGATGDHGLLCVVGAVDTNTGTGRATYNHWAALLSAALRQRELIEDVRTSEERYALASASTEDGLWDWDPLGQTCFYSERCRVLLGAAESELSDQRVHTGPREDAPELAPWLGIVHPEDHAAVVAAMTAAARHLEPFEVEHRIATPDGGYRWMLCRAVPVGMPGTPARRIVGALSDIHTRKELEEQLRQAALYDPVTGLPNRRLFLERLTWAVDQSHSRGGVDFAVAFLDLDGFKLINDSLGHLAGDDLLRTVGDRLHRDLRAVDTAARFGGDEFAVLLFGLEHEAVLSIVERIQRQIAVPILLGGDEVTVTASVGIATSTSGYTSAEEVLRDADIAMYHAKEAERGTASVFDPVMHVRATGRLRAQSELRSALTEGQFVVHYQPMVALDGSGLASLEALVRWEHPERGLLLPGEFLPVMSETGAIVTLGQWVVDAVCEQIARWRSGYAGELTVSVNLSHREFWSEHLLRTVTQALDRHGVPPECLVLEITESVIMVDAEAARQIMAELQAVGLRLHIDDFGTGHSSLQALRSFPVEALKIDQSFVRQLDVDHQTTELVRIILDMGRALGIDVVAEGVETTEQAERLQAMGCRTAQGWLFARAVSGTETTGLLGTRLAEISTPVS